MSSDASTAVGGDWAIEVEHASKVYRLYERPSHRLLQSLWGGRRQWYREFTALADVDFTLRRGEVLGVVGVNGAGKSTLLQLIAGTLRPSSGRCQTRGRVAALLELGSGFNPEFTGRENIYLNAATIGLTRAEIDQRLEAIIEFAGIGVHIDQPVKTYSSGMYVRLAFSIATSVDPDILIVDEALSVGDGAFARRSFDRIMHIRSRGATVLFCSHTLFHIEVFCDRALWLHQGQVRAFGAVTPVLAQYQAFLDALGEPAAAAAAHEGQAPLDLGESDSSAATAGTEAVTGAAQGHARLLGVRVELDGQEGTELYGTSQQSCLRMHLEFASDPAQPAPSAALVISSDAGRILATHLSQQSGPVLERDPGGRGRASITLPRVPFNKGRYRIGAYLLCERGIHVYQWIDPVAHMQLHHAGKDQGFVLLDAAWSTGA